MRDTRVVMDGGVELQLRTLVFTKSLCGTVPMLAGGIPFPRTTCPLAFRGAACMSIM